MDKFDKALESAWLEVRKELIETLTDEDQKKLKDVGALKMCEGYFKAGFLAHKTYNDTRHYNE